EREFPEKPFTGACRERRVENLRVFSVGPVKADVDTAAPIPLLLAVIVEGELAGPAVIRLPGGVGALKDQIGAAIIADDEDEVALKLFTFSGEFAEIDPARPVRRNHQLCARFPLTF